MERKETLPPKNQRKDKVNRDHNQDTESRSVHTWRL